MAEFILDDGFPESREYDSRKIHFDENNPAEYKRMMRIARCYLQHQQDSHPEYACSCHKLAL